MYLIGFHDGLLLFSPIHSINDINTASSRHDKTNYLMRAVVFSRYLFIVSAAQKNFNIYTSYERLEQLTVLNLQFWLSKLICGLLISIKHKTMHQLSLHLQGSWCITFQQ